MTVKMSEVAKAAGLALSTVSEILKGKPGYNEETRAHVLRIAAKLHYRPNPISRALSGGQSMSIGLFATGQVTVYTVARRVRAVLEAAHEAGYRVYVNHAVAPAAEAEEEGCTFIRDMMTRRVDGIILDGIIHGEKLASLIGSRPIPLVSFDGAWDVGGRITIDRAQGIEEAARHLAQLGHREVGVLTSDPLIKIHSRRPLYQAALKKAGIKMAPKAHWSIAQCPDFNSKVYSILSQEFKRSTPPTAIMANNDDSALATMAALHSAGYRVPEDVSVIGFDDLPQVEYCQPALTTISFPCAEVGAKAFSMLKSMIDARASENPPPLESSVTFGTHLTIRQSTAAARVSTARP